MHLFLTVTLFVIIFIILLSAAVYFASKGFKAAGADVSADFSSIGHLESFFAKCGKLGVLRNIIYINISLENARSLYSDAKALKIFSDIKPILLKNFAGSENSMIAYYDKKNFVAVSKTGAETAEKTAEKCIYEINQCLLGHNALNVVDIRVGCYSCASSKIGFDEAINRAKQACTMAENENLNFAKWNSTDGKSLENKIKIENRIENEIDNNRFFLEYQPVVDAKTKKVTGAEVLSRLNSEENGILAPGKFISALGSVGLSGKFDYYIFEKNCKWISNNPAQRGKYSYTVNFSRKTLCDEEFAEKIADITNRYALKSSNLSVEVLENREITENEKRLIITNLKKLRSQGFKVLLDDFGSGYTSFDDLQNFPIDIVKIDRTIIGNASTDETGLVIFNNFVKTAKDIGLTVVCEGIETEQQERIAENAGCDRLQGFFYYRPMSASSLEELLEKQSFPQ